MKTALLIGVLLLTSCGAPAKNCQSTCRKLYDETECAIQLAGVTTDDAIDFCEAECEEALLQTGDLCVELNGEQDCYEPTQKYPASDPPALINEKRAAAWMDCIWDRAPGVGPSKGCADLDPSVGYCQPI
jgi:hypothetical protein